MKGLELARGYYEEYGAPMIRQEFAEWENVIAVGLVGEGSECFGYDDELSQDHDFEPGFCLFLPDEIDSRTAFRLERAYAKLPKTYAGAVRLAVQPVGGNRHGVIRIGDFYLDKIGRRDGLSSYDDWLSLADSYLSVATNGQVFRDDLGLFTRIRESLMRMPEDVRLKKLAGRLLLMAQSGQYNYCRCIGHGETGAAQLALAEFANHAIHAAFLLNGRYCPFYKWSFRALRQLERLASLADPLEFLLSTENDSQLVQTKAAIVEDLAGMILSELQAQKITSAICSDLEKHAYSVNDQIKDSALRNRHILAGVC